MTGETDPLLAQNQTIKVEEDFGSETQKEHLAHFGFFPKGIPHDDGAGQFNLTLPESVYSSIIVTPMLFQYRHSCTKIIEYIIPQVLCYFIVMGLEIIFIRYMIENVNINGNPGCVDHHTRYNLLLFASIIVVIAMSVKSLVNTIDMIRWVSYVPKVENKAYEAQQKYMNYRDSRTDFLKQNYQNQHGEEIDRVAIEFSPCYLYGFVYPFVLLPKLCIGLLFIVFGVLYAMDQNTQDNTMDISIIGGILDIWFILQLDDIMYNVLTPTFYKSWIVKSSRITLAKAEIVPECCCHRFDDTKNSSCVKKDMDRKNKDAYELTTTNTYQSQDPTNTGKSTTTSKDVQDQSKRLALEKEWKIKHDYQGEFEWNIKDEKKACCPNMACLFHVARPYIFISVIIIGSIGVYIPFKSKC